MTSAADSRTVDLTLGRVWIFQLASPEILNYPYLLASHLHLVEGVTHREPSSQPEPSHAPARAPERR
jgi:hypothetical protein